eukprot:6194472-Lingulodinium_polyedra.AAC.1
MHLPPLRRHAAQELLLLAPLAPRWAWRYHAQRLPGGPVLGKKWSWALGGSKRVLPLLQGGGT